MSMKSLFRLSGKIALSAAIGVSVFCLSGSAAYAQASASTNAGIIQEKILEENKETPVRPEEKKALPKNIVDKRPALLQKLEGPGGKVLIKKFVLNGVTHFKAEDFKTYLTAYRDRELSVEDLNQIAADIQQFYRQRGYITTFAYIPVQDIKDNTVEIRVVEGYIGEISVEGGKYFDKEYVRKKFKVREGDTILYKDLIKNVRRLNENPDRNVKAVLTKGEKTETTDIALDMTDRRPRHMFMEYDNRGTKYTGKSKFSLGYADNNLFGFDDILSLRFLKSNEKLIGGSFDYNMPIDALDMRAGTYFSHVQEVLGKEFRVLDATGSATTWGFYVTQRFLDEEHLRGGLGAGLDIKRNSNFILGSQTSSDNLSVLKLNCNLDGDDRWGRTYVGQELDFGIPDFAGSLGTNDPKSSRLGAGGDFVKYILRLKRQINLPFSSFLLLSETTQFSPDKLLAGEQFYIGGMDTVRGYPELEFMGDYGYNVNVELRTPVFFLPKRLSLYDKVQLVYFVDFGQGFLRDALVGEKKSESLLGAGIGLRLSLWKNFYLRLDWGFPIDPETSDGSSSTVYVLGHLDLF